MATNFMRFKVGFHSLELGTPLPKLFKLFCAGAFLGQAVPQRLFLLRGIRFGDKSSVLDFKKCEPAAKTCSASMALVLSCSQR